MSTTLKKEDANQLSIIIDEQNDTVAVAKQEILKGSLLSFRNDMIEIQQDIKKGQRFAVCDSPEGEYVYQYGYAFGKSKGIQKGALVNGMNVVPEIPDSFEEDFQDPRKTEYIEKYIQKTFQGYIRSDGRVGTRNFYLVIPTSMCASQTAQQIEKLIHKKTTLDDYSNLDGVLALSHTEGCGCDSTISIDRLLKVIEGYVRHPNVCGCFILDLGCEQTNYEKVSSYLAKFEHDSVKPIDWMTVEESGGVAKTRQKACEIILSRLKKVSNIDRQACLLEKLIVGTECGASDTFSGITANPLIGRVVDKVVWGKGRVILSEIPEMLGTYSMLLSRFRSLEIAQKFQQALDWYEDLARRLHLTLDGNLVPKNIEGGLINKYMKSLGAVLKGGSTVIEDVIDYADPVTKQGLTIMQGPGGDLESVTGMVASGANLVRFATGQLTPTGNAICPVIKVATRTELFQKLNDDLDFNAGLLMDQDVSLDGLGDELLSLMLKISSGQQSKSELLEQRQFQIWTAGKLPL